MATTCASVCLNGGSCVNGVCMCTSQYVGPTCQYRKYNKNLKFKRFFFYLIESPCVTNNPCLNSATCFGRYNTNGSLYTQCFCLLGYTGVNCESKYKMK
jgi:hypothetical protein